MLTATTVTGGALVAAVLAVETGQDSAVTVALISVLGGFGVAVVTGVFALLKDRKPEPPSVRYVDPETSNALPRALAELYEDALEEKTAAVQRAERAEAERDSIKVWALEHGWTP